MTCRICYQPYDDRLEPLIKIGRLELDLFHQECWAGLEVQAAVWYIRQYADPAYTPDQFRVDNDTAWMGRVGVAWTVNAPQVFNRDNIVYHTTIAGERFTPPPNENIHITVAPEDGDFDQLLADIEEEPFPPPPVWEFTRPRVREAAATLTEDDWRDAYMQIQETRPPPMRIEYIAPMMINPHRNIQTTAE